MIHRKPGQDRSGATFPQVDMGRGGGRDKQPPPIRPSGRQDLNLRPLDPQITAHGLRSTLYEVKRHVGVSAGTPSVLALLYFAAVSRTGVRVRPDREPERVPCPP
jgi:hypothetical protein